MSAKFLTMLAGCLVLAVPRWVLAAEALQPPCAITELINPGSPSLRFPAQLPQAPYLYALCDLLEEAYFDTLLREQDLQFQQQRIATEKDKLKQSERQLADRLFTMEGKEIGARKKHLEILAKTLQIGTSPPFSEGEFWAAWHREQERYLKLSSAMNDEAVALNQQLDEALSSEEAKFQKDLAQQIRTYRDRLLGRKKL
jgi:hypothetical protein